MSPDVRTQLVDKISARYAAITRANGYSSDIGLKVFNWRKAQMDANSIPGIIWRDEDARMNNGQGQDECPIGMWEHHLKVSTEIFFKGAVCASDARLALKDVVRAVYQDRGDRWDGLAEYTDLVGHNIDTAQEGEAISAAQVLFTIVYRTPFGTL